MLWVKQQKPGYFQSTLLVWAFLSFVISKCLLAVYFFLPREGRKRG
jgi:hypothetical protein